MSNITVPRSGARAGQSANLTREPASAAPALREAGAKLFRSATRARQQFEANEFNQARLDMTRALDTLRLEYEQTTDPAAIETGWAERATGLRDRFVSGASAGLRDQIGLTFDTLAQSHALPVARHAQGMRVSQSAGTWRDYTLTVSNSYATAGPEARDQLIAQGDRMIDADLDAGFISPEEAVRRRQQLRVTGIEAEALNVVDTDPDAFLAAADAGRFDPLGGDSVERLRARARREVAARAAAQAKAGQKAQEAAMAQIGKDLGFVADLAGDGLTAAQEAAGFMDRADVRAHPDYPMAAAAIQLREAIPDLNRLAPAELQTLIAEQRATPLSEKWQAERIAVLENLLATAQAEWSADPVARAGSVGFDMPPLDMEALGAPASIAALKARRGQAQALAQAGYVPDSRAALLSDDERSALQGRLARDQPARAREQALRAVVLGFGADAPALLRDLDQSRAVQQVANIMLNHGRAGVAFGNAVLADVMRGEEKIAAGTVRLPGDQVTLPTFDAVTGGYFDDDPQAKARIMDAARAIYAAEAEPLDPRNIDGKGLLKGDEETAFEAALHRALGGSTDTRGRSVGGLQEVLGAVTELPPGVAAEDVEDAWTRVLSAARGTMTGTGPNPDLLTGASAGVVEQVPGSLDLLNRAAANGATIGDWANADTLRRVALEPVKGAPGFYVLVRTRGGQPMVMGDTDNNPFMLHLPSLLEAAR